jgi:hypothetical protein
MIFMRVWLTRLFALLLAANAFSAQGNDETRLAIYMESVAASLGAAQIAALDQITDADRRNLAMTYYFRAGSSIAARWSWSNEQIKAYRQSEEFTVALAEIEKIRARFAADNSDARLYVNVDIRSLEVQLARWQTVNSIGIAALELRKAALLELGRAPYSTTPNTNTLKEFRRFLSTWRPKHAPTLAAPGLTLHGQGRAFDFQIQDQSGRTIAGVDSSTVKDVWDGQGWTEKLTNAVHAASKQFVGPLARPYEPWHYEYRPSH